ncbi:hypothetical protein NLJ89_g1482 [Agrocybe chaxingu]|uniref:3'-5' exonuclease n=1 Tax=Agrocybe chaxingu TaxID=84603 RepID=A0A9W8TDC7_9AGAR|nr:hypothetical protein NLJ89_g1482 [Agrocybe chaxingu]
MPGTLSTRQVHVSPGPLADGTRVPSTSRFVFDAAPSPRGFASGHDDQRTIRGSSVPFSFIHFPSPLSNATLTAPSSTEALVPQKRGPGRPRKDAVDSEAPPRKRGRPSKLADIGAESDCAPLVKQPVGRPRKETPFQAVKFTPETLSSAPSPQSSSSTPADLDQPVGNSNIKNPQEIPSVSRDQNSHLNPPLISTTRTPSAAAIQPSTSRHCTQHAPPSITSPTPTPASFQPPSTRPVIPDENPQLPVELEDDEDDNDDGVGDGLGDEDEDEDEGDESEDQREFGGIQEAVQEGERRSLPRHPQPAWLQQAFVNVLAECEKRDQNMAPPIYYRDHTFWRNPPSPFFALANISITPALLFTPPLFVWDPQALYRQLPCPICGQILIRHAAMSRPRRVVDIQSSFWIIGFRYRCTQCVNPQTGKKTMTWRSWDPKILERLPPHLAAEFPAQLSHRSGISNRLFSLMRSCFQSGMGAKKFSDAILVQHLLRYDELHLQYLDCIFQRRQMATWLGKKFDSFPLFEDKTANGYHSFVPSAKWFRDRYDLFIEDHRHHFDQHTAMLTAEIFSIDHSHKLTKHVAKINGERIFCGLLSVANEKGEIRAANFVHTKAHSQFTPLLGWMRESLELYGHEPPKLAFTDLPTDRAFLEAAFPSLREGVVPIEKYGHLEPFILPAGVQLHIYHERSAIDIAMSSILENAPIDAGAPDLVVGYDCEWNVLMEHGRCERGEVAVVQIAFKNHVYILQIHDYVQQHRLPEMLLLLLQNPRVRKVGRMVSSDLKLLYDIVRPSAPFVGALDLASYAKERHVVTNARCSLADLCAAVLGKCLNKNVAERASMAWEEAHLTPEQQSYAACDAYAPLLIYEQLSTLSVPTRVPPGPLTPSSLVLVYNTENTRVVAYGRLSSDLNLSHFNDIPITERHTVVTITKIVVPASTISSHRRRSLQSFGSPPFDIVCLRSHLRFYDPSTFSLSNATVLPTVSETTTESGVANNMVSQASLAFDHDDNDLDDGMGTLLQDLQDDGEASRVWSKEGGKNLEDNEVDEASAAFGEEIMSSVPDRWDTVVHSRVIKDIFHVFNMLRLPKNHGLRKEFGRAFRDAVLLFVREDFLRISAWLPTLNPPVDFNQVFAARPKWMLKHCRRFIPPPDKLLPLVKELFSVFGPLKDATTRAPLFTQQQWHASKQILELIRQGFVSDPPGIPLYYVIGLDAKAANLPIYRCARGTNFLEGGVHSHLLSRLPTSGTSVRHLNACFCDFVLGHNLRVGTLNTTGQKYRGHYDIWTTNKIQEQLVTLQDALCEPYELTGWVNTDLYILTKERLGILPLPDDIRESSGMAPFNTASFNPRQRHLYLARMQGTRKAVLPIHMPEEVKLWRELVTNNGYFNSPSGPTSYKATAVWNEHADRTDGVFYKTTENLKAYFSQWKTRINVTVSLSMSSSDRAKVMKGIRDPSRTDGAPAFPFLH